MNSIFSQKLPSSVRMGHKICMRQCFSTNMFTLKNVATLDVKLVNIPFTPQRHTYISSLLVLESIVKLPCTYFVTIGVFPSCTCLDFVSNAPCFKHSYFLSYKHMYYIYNVHMNLVIDIHIHQPSLNGNDVDVNLFVVLDCISGGNIISNS